jgi:hypothetical protein
MALLAALFFVSSAGGFTRRGAQDLLARVVTGNQAAHPDETMSDRLTIWARLPIQAPECDCHTPPLAQVYSSLKDEHLEGGLTDEGSIGSWQYMSFTLDLRQVSRQHILDLITKDGGVILPGRPASLPTATVGP